ncbi:GNAT family N-acetyltransferase [Nocardioides aequoreus]|uniref:GNAT family N-acetyltransferase n=1 Tax=Nocardioides aequoreus TaxID=397278 RepID=UPI00068C5047|nr:GNAT family N-acetyltransferase [Nocardioides aequoreus]
MRREGQRFRLSDGPEVWIRPVRTDDAAGLQRAFSQLSERSRHQRFMTGTPFLTDARARQLADLDHVRHHALLALAGGKSGDVVGVARFIRDDVRPLEADLALTIADAWQRRGLASVLLAMLVARAVASGVRFFVMEMLADNMGMAALVRAAGGEVGPLADRVASARLDLLAEPTSRWVDAVMDSVLGDLESDLPDDAGPAR